MNFLTLELLIRLLASAVGSLSFGIIFRIDKRHLLAVAVSGFFTYFIFHTVAFFGGSVFASAILATCFTALFGEIMARIRRAPVILYLLTGCIPIVPGGDAYYSMKYLLEGNTPLAGEKLLQTAEAALGIAGGMVLIPLLFGLFQDLLHAYKKRKREK